VVEPTGQSALTGRRVARLAREHLDAAALFVASKIKDKTDRARVARLLGEPVDFEIPADPAVVDAERRQMAVIDAAPDSRIVRAVEHLANAVQERTLDAA
jgi:CO dehydrogenase nickel-insertion accessory protein CooC1